MSTQKSPPRLRVSPKAKNLGLSALVVATLGSYALSQGTNSLLDSPSLQPTAAVVPEHAASEAITSRYLDGAYRGDPIAVGQLDHVQVEVIIENGEIANFNILDYPHTRSMSQQISQVAIPYLMKNAVQ